jgi:hypothetical protein
MITNVKQPAFLGARISQLGSEFEYRKSQEFSLLFVVRASSRDHPAFFAIGTGGSFPNGKVARE